MKILGEATDLKDKKVFLRVDFNVPVNNGEIGEKYRIESHHKETIDFLVSAGAKIGLVSHVENSFESVVDRIGEILGHQLVFEEDILNPKLDSQLTLFENIRKYEGEERNDPGFAEKLAKNFDLYVNDAFSVSHRKHASISAITKFLPSYAGFLVEKEIANLKKVLNEPAQGKTIILGGVKASTKLPVIKNFLSKTEHILVGGALANAIFKHRGIKIGSSFVDSEAESILIKLHLNDQKITLPQDIVVSNDKTGKSLPDVRQVGDLKMDELILDIGSETIKSFSGIVRNSKVVIFNGPLGLAEVDIFSVGTKMIIDSIVRSGAFSVVGGGDTLALVEKLGSLDKFSYVSTGGGAMLEFLAGNKLPGLEALGYYND